MADRVDVGALLEASSASKTRQCGTCRWLESRPTDERAKWEEAIAQPLTFPAEQVARAMAMVESEVKVPGAAGIRGHFKRGHSS